MKNKMIINENRKNSFNDLLKPWAHPNILNFIKNLKKDDLLVFDAPESDAWIAKQNLNCYVVTPNSWKEALKRYDFSRVIIASSNNEAEIKFKVKDYVLEHYSNVSVKAIYSDIIYNRSFRVREVNNPAGSVNPKLKYIVLCTPRSGSTVLCDLLEKTGQAGFPKEHLTKPVYEALKAGAFTYTDWYSTLQANAISDNLAFGTKIITERLEWLRTIYSDAQLRMSFDQHKVIRLTRGSLEEQAVSKWFAQVLNKWHVKGKTESSDTSKMIERYKFDSIYKVYKNLIDDEARLEKQIAQIFGDEVIEVEYSCLVNDIYSEMKRITDFLGLDINVSELSFKTDFVRHDTEAKNTILDMFTKELTKN